MLPTIFLKYFKFTLYQDIFDQAPCFSSLNPSLDTHWVTGLFLQLRHPSGTLDHLILDLVFVQLKSLLKLILCHRFSRINFVVSVFFVLFVFGVYCALNTQQGGYVRITSLIIIYNYYYYYYLQYLPIRTSFQRSIGVLGCTIK